MKIELRKIKIRELVEGYVDNEEEGVFAWGGRLNVRPKYQREYVYGEKQREAVIETVTNDFPLNVMYWVKSENDEYEVLDGQQRTISICQFCVGKYSFDGRYYHNLQIDEKEQILNYELMVYFCEGTDSEKLNWFQKINIAGVQLTDQEILNAIYSGEWTTDAKRHFSKTNCVAYKLAEKYMKGTPIRQDYLETAISWISKGNIKTYMGNHQHDANANELWLYFQAVIAWVKVTFPKYRKEMKGLDWGLWYNKLKDTPLDPKKLEEQVAELMQDEELEKKTGIYQYVLFGDEKYLNRRKFKESDKRTAYEKQNGKCLGCGGYFKIEEMHADHIIPWSKGGKTDKDNCRVLCRKCNQRLGNREIF
jgi:hypothetical protein